MSDPDDHNRKTLDFEPEPTLLDPELELADEDIFEMWEADAPTFRLGEIARIR